VNTKLQSRQIRIKRIYKVESWGFWTIFAKYHIDNIKTSPHNKKPISRTYKYDYIVINTDTHTTLI